VARLSRKRASLLSNAVILATFGTLADIEARIVRRRGVGAGITGGRGVSTTVTLAAFGTPATIITLATFEALVAIGARISVEGEGLELESLE
jgi:hypothetical protein